MRQISQLGKDQTLWSLFEGVLQVLPLKKIKYNKGGVYYPSNYGLMPWRTLWAGLAELFIKYRISLISEGVFFPPRECFLNTSLDLVTPKPSYLESAMQAEEQIQRDTVLHLEAIDLSSWLCAHG